MNTFGNKLRLTTFGESHGTAMGGVLDGFPANFSLDFASLQHDLQRRKYPVSFSPVASTSARARQEDDVVEWLSGIYEGKTLGTPIAFLVRNTAQREADYDALCQVYRPSHADYTYQMKYGIRDPRGGGRASARETIVRVIAGNLAKQWLEVQGVHVKADIVQIGSAQTSEQMAELLQDVTASQDSIGGIVRCEIKGVPVGVGQPLYDKLSARLAYAMLSINACKGFDFGSGFEGVAKRGSELNDAMSHDKLFLTNHSGGIQGGISNGETIYFRTVFKPTPSIAQPQATINQRAEDVTLRIAGRHDACVVLRAPVIVEAMAALVLMDEML